MDSMTSEQAERYTFQAQQEDAGQRVDLFLTAHLPHSSRAQVQRAAQAGALLVNGERVRVSHRMRSGDTVEIQLLRPPDLDAPPQPENIPLEIVYADEAIIVVNKPAGMVVHPAAGHRSGTLVNALLGSGAFPEDSMRTSERPGIVHRLDKDTSGLLIVAKSELAHRRLAEQLKNRTLKRVYQAVAWGHFKTDAVVFEGAIGRSPSDRKRMAVTSKGRAARTNAHVLERFSLADLLEISLDTGRTHQIRVHLSHAGHPIVGDGTYSGGASHLKGIAPSERLFGRRMLESIGRPALHALSLALLHPITGKSLEFHVNPPPDFSLLTELCRQ